MVLTGFPAFFARVQSPFSFRLLTQISRRPTPPRRSETKNSVRPSADKEGCDSHSGLFTLDPRFLGSVHSSPMRILSNRSQLPNPCLRTHDVKINFLPSADMVHVPSVNLVLIFFDSDSGPVQRPRELWLDIARSSS